MTASFALLSIFATIVTVDCDKDYNGNMDFLNLTSESTEAGEGGGGSSGIMDYSEVKELLSSDESNNEYVSYEHFSAQEEYDVGNCEVFIVDKDADVLVDQMDLMNISEGDIYNMNHVLGVKGEFVKPMPNLDIVSLEITQYIKLNEEYNFHFFVLNRTYKTRYRVIQVLPVKIVQGRAMRALFTSTSHPRHPKFKYYTDLVMHDRKGDAINSKDLYEIKLRSLHVQYVDDPEVPEKDKKVADIYFQFLRNFTTNQTRERDISQNHTTNFTEVTKPENHTHAKEISQNHTTNFPEVTKPKRHKHEKETSQNHTTNFTEVTKPKKHKHEKETSQNHTTNLRVKKPKKHKHEKELSPSHLTYNTTVTKPKKHKHKKETSQNHTFTTVTKPKKHTHGK